MQGGGQGVGVELQLHHKTNLRLDSLGGLGEKGLASTVRTPLEGGGSRTGKCGVSGQWAVNTVAQSRHSGGS